jgi:hypothetical protein
MLAPFPDVLRRYTPNFQYILYDLSCYSDDDIRGAVFSRAFLLLFKHIFDDDITEQLPSILGLLREIITEPSCSRVLRMFLLYIFNATDKVNAVDLHHIVEQELPTHGGEVMTLAEQLEQKGFEQGMQQGMQQGLIEAIEVSLRLKFGEEGLKLMSLIRLIHDTEQLKSLKNLILDAQELSEVQSELLNYS